MYNVEKIADWFVWYNEFVRNIQNEDTDNITNMKLQKLLYYAQSAFISIKNKPLFSNPILAWQHGPVIKEIYEKYKNNGNQGILDYDEENIKSIEKEDVDLLIDVYNLFGEYSAWGLRNLTHSEKPWKTTERNGIISLDKMSEEFKEKYL